jgi:calcineurin-like phosphoesterase family protein
MTTRSKLSVKATKSIRLVLISDTHELHRELDVPDGDILIHCGDISMMSRSLAAIEDFDDWLGGLPHKVKLLVPGNHEFVLENPGRRGLITNATMLVNESVTVMGLRIWGSPTTPLVDGAFGLISDRDRARLYEQIPNDTNIVITHGPPYGVLDQAPGSEYHAGCPQLLAAMQRVKPRLHVFGHAHGCFGMMDTPETLFANVALLGSDGSLSNPAVVLQMNR